VNLLVITWSMFAAACGLLGLIQLFLYSNNRRELVYVFSAIMAFSAMVVAFGEMRLFSTPEVGQYQKLLLWQNLAIALVVVPMTWSMRIYLPTARTWAAILITGLWVAGMLVNFLLPGNLTFVEINSIDQNATTWGDVFYVPNGQINPWKWLADITIILIPLYMIDAVWRARDRGRGQRGIVVTVGVVLFMLFAGGQAMLVDMGLLDAPYMISAAFLSIVFALTWVLARDAVRARVLALEVARARHETERLMRANLLGEVASALAHELNQPLAAILGNAQAAHKFLSRSDPDLEEIDNILIDIIRDDKRARDIIVNMRQMLRGDESLHTCVDLESAIREVLDFAGSQFDEDGILVRIEKSGDLPDVHGGLVALQQVILNLLFNARHALLESRVSDREIHIQLRKYRDGAEIEVRDSGPGIEQDLLARLFDPFVTTKGGNLGMGLSVCRRIVEAHGGQIGAENAKDGGARFLVWLPAAR
jgi:signal transduction histidine kinase